MNTYDMVLYWQNKYLIMEKEVRKAQKGIARLKRREKHLIKCIENYRAYVKSNVDKSMRQVVEQMKKFGTE